MKTADEGRQRRELPEHGDLPEQPEAPEGPEEPGRSERSERPGRSAAPAPTERLDSPSERLGSPSERLDRESVSTAKRTLLQLLERAGVYSGDAEELIGLVEAGALALAHEEISELGHTAPADGKGEPYAAGWLDGTRAAADALDARAERALQHAVGSAGPTGAPEERTPVGRMEMERAKVTVLPLYLSFTPVSDLDPEVSEQVLTAVLRTMGPRQRAAYAGRLAEFVAERRPRLERLYAEYGPGSTIAIHGRYSLLHSPTSVAVLERLAEVPSELREEWDAAELPPAWLDGLTTAWDASGREPAP